MATKRCGNGKQMGLKEIRIGDGMTEEDLESMDNLLTGFNKNSEGLYTIHDRFSFDNLFGLLLDNGFEHEEVLSFVLDNCSLSVLVFQERIYNKWYLNISPQEIISEDLKDLRNQILHGILAKEEQKIRERI